jgi:chromosome segregation ATPase
VEAALVNQLASVQKEVDRGRSRADELGFALESAGAELVELRGREPEFHARLQAVQQTLAAVRAEVTAQRAELDGAVAAVRARELAPE